MKHYGLWLAALVVLVAGGLTLWRLYTPPVPSPPVADTAPPADVLARLTRGVNLSGWLQHGAVDEREAPNAADWARLRALGLSHARILADPAALLDARGLPRPEVLARLRAAIEAAAAQELLVVLALQLPEAHKAALATSEPARIALAGVWRTLAAALRDVPPQRLLLEPLNEPGMPDAAASRALMALLVRELRAALPAHTLVVSGHGYAGVEELLALTPLADRNLVYSFHLYAPHNFTHQGADWGASAWRTLAGVPYPSSPERVAALLPGLQGEARELLRWHGEERWDADRLAATVEQAAQWARGHGVPLWCGEFGVIRGAPAADRAAWLRDVRTALEARGIGWAHWDYAGKFGMVAGPPGARVVDKAVVEALDLAPG